MQLEDQSVRLLADYGRDWSNALWRLAGMPERATLGGECLALKSATRFELGRIASAITAVILSATFVAAAVAPAVLEESLVVPALVRLVA